MKTLLTVLLTFIFSLAAHSQSSFINACVSDSTDQALPDANVLFFRQDSLVAGISTGKNGCFTLRLDTGKYEIRILLLGYEEYTDEIVLQQGGISLPAMILKKASIELDEVLVSGEKRPYEAKLNKDIYHLPANVKKSSPDIFQVLMNLPVLDIDEFNKKISLKGTSNSVVLVNNIRRNRDYLQLIRPENIERVEVSHSSGTKINYAFWCDWHATIE